MDVQQDFWSLDAGRLPALLRSDPIRGLSAVEARKRLEETGRNEIRARPGPTALALLLGQFKSLVTWVLFAACVLSAWLGETGDTVAIGAIVLLNAFIGFYQEFRAENAVAALRRMTAPVARVVRDAEPLFVPATEVVPGDVLLLEAGDIVAADARLLDSSQLRALEAALTGESAPVDKQADVVCGQETPLAERRNMVYMGTSIAAGQGRALVVSTGMNTEMGRIAHLLESAGDAETPLQRRLDRVGRLLIGASLGIVALVYLLGWLRGEPAWEMLLASVSLAVAAVPEGMPTVVTISLALGMARMARRHALIRRLPAVETLGSAQVICTDKTGTLTTGEMTVRALWVGGREIEVTGDGYAPRGEFRERGAPLDHRTDAPLRDLLFGGAASSEAFLHPDGQLLGDPTEGAVLAAAAKAGIHRPDIESAFARLGVLPFDPERKRMTIVRRAQDGARAFTKGAPEVVLNRCRFWLGPDGKPIPLDADARRIILKANEDLAGRGLRVLAAAVRELEQNQARSLEPESLEHDLTFLGLLAMKDPPRPEAREAIEKCRRAGIRVVMITGDQAGTARAAAAELGLLLPGDEVLSGQEIAALSDAELQQRVQNVGVFARVTAEDKLRIVRALRSRGLVVAMTGDGVNDAPAVKAADIGIAMGITGTEVTKEASDMVITDDNFASIAAAVEEGRGIYDNVKKSLLYLLSGNAAEIIVVLAAILLGWPLPLLPLHLLWINLVTDGLPALALATDPVERSSLTRPPRPREEPIADTGFLRTMAAAGVLTAFAGLAAFWYGYPLTDSVDAARGYAFTAIVLAELLKSLSLRSPTAPFCSRAAGVNPRLLAVIAGSLLLQILIPSVPVLRDWFRVTAFEGPDLLWLLPLGATPLAGLELRKLWMNRRRSRGDRHARGAVLPHRR